MVQRASNAVGGDWHGMATTFTGRGRSNYSPLPVVFPLSQNGDYNNLGTLVKDMEVAQSELQKLQVQSKFLLLKVYGLSTWRLYDTVPYKK